MYIWLGLSRLSSAVLAQSSYMDVTLHGPARCVAQINYMSTAVGNCKVSWESRLQTWCKGFFARVFNSRTSISVAGEITYLTLLQAF